GRGRGPGAHPFLSMGQGGRGHQRRCGHEAVGRPEHDADGDHQDTGDHRNDRQPATEERDRTPAEDRPGAGAHTGPQGRDDEQRHDHPGPVDGEHDAAEDEAALGRGQGQHRAEDGPGADSGDPARGAEEEGLRPSGRLRGALPGGILAGSKPKPKNWTMPKTMRMTEATRTIAPRWEVNRAPSVPAPMPRGMSTSSMPT